MASTERIVVAKMVESGLESLVGLVLRIDWEVKYELLDTGVLKLHKRLSSNSHQLLAFSPSGSYFTHSAKKFFFGLSFFYVLLLPLHFLPSY